MIDAELRLHATLDILAGKVAGEIGELVDSTEGRDRLLAFPGGSTPAPVFAALASKPHTWDGVTIVPGDDRLVPVDSVLSNYASIATALRATRARVIPLADSDQDYRAAGRAADDRLRRLPWPPELVWLGMGSDGHTASIFPGPDLETALESNERAIGVLPDPLPREAPVARVTLTRGAILAAGKILVTITGETKKSVIETALSQGERSAFPIGRVLAGADRPIVVHWCP